MRVNPLYILTVGLFASCQNRPIEPESDRLTSTSWCNGATMAYRFDADGSFTMRSTTGTVWGGNWSYTQPLTDIEINLRYGPNRLIQIIRLQHIQRTDSTITAIWTDEIAKEIPVSWQACDFDLPCTCPPRIPPPVLVK